MNNLPDWMRRDPNDWMKRDPMDMFRPKKLSFNPLPSVSADVEIACMRAKATKNCRLCGSTISAESGVCESCIKKHGTAGSFYTYRCEKCGCLTTAIRCCDGK